MTRVSLTSSRMSALSGSLYKCSRIQVGLLSAGPLLIIVTPPEAPFFYCCCLVASRNLVLRFLYCSVQFHGKTRLFIFAMHEEFVEHSPNNSSFPAQRSKSSCAAPVTSDKGGWSSFRLPSPWVGAVPFYYQVPRTRIALCTVLYVR